MYICEANQSQHTRREKTYLVWPNIYRNSWGRAREVAAGVEDLTRCHGLCSLAANVGAGIDGVFDNGLRRAGASREEMKMPKIVTRDRREGA